MLVLPPCNPALPCCRAVAFQRAGPARVGPVATKLQPVLDVGIVVFQPFTGRAAIELVLGQIGSSASDAMPAYDWRTFVPGSRGTGSWLTQRWRKPDSKSGSLGTNDAS